MKLMLRKLNLFLTFVVLININLCGAQANVPPDLMATGDQIYCPLSQINVATSFDIVDPDDTEIEALHIQISTGYVNGQDQLILTGTHPTIVDTWNVTEGKLSLRGVGGVNVSYTDLIAAVNDVVFQSSSPNVSGDKFFSFTIGDANYLPSTDHYYEYVPSTGITWTSARTAAAGRTYFGLQGYLATITSAEEAQLSGEQAAGAGWIGGSDAAAEGVWKWMTGPEAGTTFWNGGINGTTPNYANWNTAEPNNVGDEDYAHVTHPNVGIRGSWNDLPNGGDSNPLSVYHPQGYIVEYGGMSGDPVVNISASTKISVPSIDSIIEAEVCHEGSLTLEATGSSGTVIWFDAPTGGNQVHSGSTLVTPVLNTTTSYYALASVNGCLEGARTQVTATIKPLPTITASNGALICEDGSATLTATSSAGVINWYDVPTGGTALVTGNSFTTPFLTATTTYYVDATHNACISAGRTPVTLTVQKTPPPIANTPQTFCDVDSATIGDLSITGDNVLWYASDTDTTPLNTTDLLTSTTYYATQTVNGCESPTRLAVEVIIYDTVVPLAAQDIPAMEICDDDQDGNDTNGIAAFDLTQHEALLLNGSPALAFNFLYFSDAGYSMPIASPQVFENTVTGGQTVYVRIENNTDTNCFTDVSFDIQVNPLPVTQVSIIFKNCDEDGIPDGYTDYNLTEANAVITNEDLSTLNITYHLSMAEADAGANAINPSPFNNQTANTVFARVEHIVTGCFRTVTVNLEVSTTSFTLGYLETLETCDDDADIDGQHTFNLSNASLDFIDEFPSGQNLSVHYYRSLTDAQLEDNEILPQNDYINETPFSQLLYVRVESDDNGECFGIGPHLRLVVHPRPQFEVDQSSIFCLDGSPITLETFNPQGAYTYEWFDDNNAVISNSSTATVDSGGTYTVIATSNFNCQSFPVSFNVVESAISNIDQDDISIVELSDNNSITIDPGDIGIGDYEFALDAEFGPFQDEPFFNQVYAGAHTLYVRDKNGCGTAALQIFVMGFPKFFTPNNDGFNDTWNVKGLSQEYIQNTEIFVYDRYGKLIKQLVPNGSGWNGTFNGEVLNSSDYWFVVNLTDNTGMTQIYKGHFSLVR